MSPLLLSPIHYLSPFHRFCHFPYLHHSIPTFRHLSISFLFSLHALHVLFNSCHQLPPPVFKPLFRLLSPTSGSLWSSANIQTTLKNFQIQLKPGTYVLGTYHKYEDCGITIDLESSPFQPSTVSAFSTFQSPKYTHSGHSGPRSRSSTHANRSSDANPSDFPISSSIS